MFGAMMIFMNLLMDSNKVVSLFQKFLEHMEVILRIDFYFLHCFDLLNVVKASGNLEEKLRCTNYKSWNRMKISVNVFILLTVFTKNN